MDFRWHAATNKETVFTAEKKKYLWLQHNSIPIDAIRTDASNSRNAFGGDAELSVTCRRILRCWPACCSSQLQNGNSLSIVWQLHPYYNAKAFVKIDTDFCQVRKWQWQTSTCAKWMVIINFTIYNSIHHHHHHHHHQTIFIFHHHHVHQHHHLSPSWICLLPWMIPAPLASFASVVSLWQREGWKIEGQVISIQLKVGGL